ncbi:elongin A, like [Stegastes partitus]|uniref:Elongin A, like n=1 Tax=Stegastes partitus TaxID=144197 RepID=A0A9Y4NEN9_9TELE|nr:PREDICTED: transcription elongation factor B polypeptide 3-like [Stegastes partitus]
MARSSQVAKKVMRCKLQLSDSAEPATIVKILQKLKDLDITLDILAETGIGKAVNSFRRHKQAGEFAKSLVKGWKKLVPKGSTSHGEDMSLSETVSVKHKLDDRGSPDNGRWAMEGVNNYCLTSYSKNQDSSDEAPFETGNRRADSEKERCEKRKRKMDKDVNHNIVQQENQTVFENDILRKKTEIQEDKSDNAAVSKRKKNSLSDRKPEDRDDLFEDKSLEDTHQKSRFDSLEKRSTSESGRLGSNTKSKPSRETKETFSFECSDASSKMIKQAKDDRCSGISRSSEAKERREKTAQKKQNKKVKTKHNDKESTRDQEQPSMSFESCLNYDVNVFKRKEQSAVKKHPKKIKMVVKEPQTKDPDMKPFQSPPTSPKQVFQDSMMHLLSIPLPAALPEIEKPSTVEYFDRNVEKESDFCDASEESAVFTGQRLNSKMQVYSGAKTAFLPAMMSLHQQCIRTLQNNINLLYETGGVPFELLEPVLERCTPEQLLRIEECNPIYVGVTDHLWGKHCQRDFKEARLQEYESWKEMYIRLSEERERKLQRLTKTIVMAHSKKPKGRQVKMAFIHTVAKPPRDVRIQQEIHGTAVQQPHQLRCSVKVQDHRSRAVCNEPSRSSSTSSGGSNTQDPRKKTRVAPMMAKSLKAFKKQLGRR